MLPLQALTKDKEKALALSELIIVNLIFIRNNEIISVDAFLMKEEGYVDFSSVTGEAIPTTKVL